VHGHAVGDAVLRRIADPMKERLRATDVIGRLGGDEFAVLLRNVNAAQAEVIASDLLVAIRATRVVLESGAETRLTRMLQDQVVVSACDDRKCLACTGF